MKKEELFEVLGDIDEAHIKAARVVATRIRKPIWIKWTVLAACLCLAVGLGALRRWRRHVRDLSRPA